MDTASPFIFIYPLGGEPACVVSRKEVTGFSTRFERFLRTPLSILGLRRLQQQGVKSAAGG
jgi:hypothetical protein